MRIELTTFRWLMSLVIMRLTRYLLRYQGTQIRSMRWLSPNQLATNNCYYFCRLNWKSFSMKYYSKLALLQKFNTIWQRLKKKKKSELYIVYSIVLTLGSLKKISAPSEDRTHDLQIALSFVIMRLTRYLLRYQGTHAHVGWEDLRMNCPRYLHNMDTFVRKHELLSYSLSKNDAHYQ